MRGNVGTCERANVKRGTCGRGTWNVRTCARPARPHSCSAYPQNHPFDTRCPRTPVRGRTGALRAHLLIVCDDKREETRTTAPSIRAAPVRGRCALICLLCVTISGKKPEQPPLRYALRATQDAVVRHPDTGASSRDRIRLFVLHSLIAEVGLARRVGTQARRAATAFVYSFPIR